MTDYHKSEEWVCHICNRRYISEVAVVAHIAETHPQDIRIVPGTLVCNEDIPGAIQRIALEYRLENRDDPIRVVLVNPGANA